MVYVANTLEFAVRELQRECVTVGQRLQRIQNSAARMVCSEPAFKFQLATLHHCCCSGYMAASREMLNIQVMRPDRRLSRHSARVPN